jgi:phosphoenolpyruvate carboxykinase (GTP)
VGQELRASGGVPRVFQVNWFRKGADGRFLWPGFGENSRVLEWILERVDGTTPARETPIGLVPVEGGVNLDGLDVPEEDMAELFRIDRDTWLAEADSTEEFFGTFEGRVPAALTSQVDRLRANLG